MKKNDVETMLLLSKPLLCKCGGKFFHIGGGKYKCNTCEEIVLDDFGKVKEFLEENGPMPMMVISECTGVSVEVLEGLLKDGRVEIAENSKYFINCQKCGCAIRSGRYCIDCAKTLANGIQRIYYNEVGEKPKNSTVKEKIHYLNKK